jgi:hypothetical protein
LFLRKENRLNCKEMAVLKTIVSTLAVIIMFSSCFTFRKQNLWIEDKIRPEPNKIGNVYALNILNEGMGSEVWFTKNLSCLQVSSEDSLVNSGFKSVHISWDKQAGDCKWLGLGIGWDAWNSKDLSSIMDSAAIQLRIYSPYGQIKSLPLAACLEDYFGNQAWTGLGSDKIKYHATEKWGIVKLPLNYFNWAENNADISAIKQFIIQFEAAGDVYFDDIEIVKMK